MDHYFQWEFVKATSLQGDGYSIICLPLPGITEGGRFGGGEAGLQQLQQIAARLPMSRGWPMHEKKRYRQSPPPRALCLCCERMHLLEQRAYIPFLRN
eukprot:975446-Amphidinium_carterae.1